MSPPVTMFSTLLSRTSMSKLLFSSAIQRSCRRTLSFKKSFTVQPIGPKTQQISLRNPMLHPCNVISLNYGKHNLGTQNFVLRPFFLHKKSFATETSATNKNKAKVRGIQKDVSPFTTKRILRRKRSAGVTPSDKVVFDGVAYATAEEIDLESLTVDLRKQGLYVDSSLPPDAADALHVEAKYKVDNEMREIFFFREGSVVFWNMPPEERTAVLQFLRRHQDEAYDNLLIEQNFEKVDFTYIDTPSQLDGDEIQLQRPELKEDGSSLLLEKFTFSNALALSVKLSIWEASLERYADSIEWILQDLKDGKKIVMSRGDVLRKTGELFTLRHLINLSSDLLDTPDFYWDRDGLETLYTKTCNNLSIARRTKVLNEKLTYCCELVELVREHLNDNHHIRLEWMIIILIMIEVLFEIVHVIERHVVPSEDSHHSKGNH